MSKSSTASHEEAASTGASTVEAETTRSSNTSGSTASSAASSAASSVKDCRASLKTGSPCKPSPKARLSHIQEECESDHEEGKECVQCLQDKPPSLPEKLDPKGEPHSVQAYQARAQAAQKRKAFNDPKHKGGTIDIEQDDFFFHEAAQLSYRDKKAAKVPSTSKRNTPVVEVMQPDSHVPYARALSQDCRTPEMRPLEARERATYTKSTPSCHTQSNHFKCSDIENASFLSRIFFRYVQPVLDQSLYSNVVDLKNFGELPAYLKVENEISLLEESIRAVRRKHPDSKYTIVRAILKTHPRRYMTFILAKFGLSLCEMAKPLIVTELILFLANKHDGEERSHAWAYQVGFTYLIVEMITNVVWENLLFMITQSVHISQNALKAVLLKKNFTMSQACSARKYSSGEVHNLMERDANSVWMLLGQLPDIMQIPFEISVSLFMVYLHVGWFALPGLAFFAVAIALNVYAARQKTTQTSEISAREDRRVQQISEAFRYVRTYKLYGWVAKFCSLIKEEYTEETDEKSKLQEFNGLVRCLQDLINRLIPTSVFFLFAFFGNQVTLAEVMLTSVMLSKAKARFQQVTQLFSYRNQMLASVGKLNDFFACSDSQQGVVLQKRKDFASDRALEVKGNFSWGIKLHAHDSSDVLADEADPDQTTTISSHLVLKDLDFKINRGELVCVVGEVGSGKSTLLHLMLGQLLFMPQKEIDFAGGSDSVISKQEMLGIQASIMETPIKEEEAPVRIHGDFSFVGEDDWIQSTSIRDNILFGLQFDQRRYVKVCLACQLEADFLNFANGDLTKIGEDGIQLSGGQKARISLARALYSKPDIVLMDNIFSGLDRRTSSAVFQEVVVDALAGKTRMLATNDVEQLEKCDKVLIMKEGRVVAHGTYDQLKDSAHLTDVFAQKKELRKSKVRRSSTIRDLSVANRSGLQKQVLNNLGGSQRVKHQGSMANQKMDICGMLRDLGRSGDCMDMICPGGSRAALKTSSDSLFEQTFYDQVGPPPQAHQAAQNAKMPGLPGLPGMKKESSVPIAKPKKTFASNPKDFKSTSFDELQSFFEDAKKSRRAEVGDNSASMNHRIQQIGQRRGSRKAFYKKDIVKQVQETKIDKVKCEERRRKLKRMSHQITQPIPQNIYKQLEGGSSNDLMQDGPEATAQDLPKRMSLGYHSEQVATKKKNDLTFTEIKEKIELWEGKGADDEALDQSAKSLRLSVQSFQDLHKKQAGGVKVTAGTFLRVLQRIGGVKTAAVLISAQFALHYVDVYTNRLNGQWASVDEQSNFDDFYTATLKLLGIFVIAFGLGVLIEVILSRKISQLSRVVHDEVLQTILQAPINLYYDVTPVGVILRTYQRDAETFNSGLLQSLQLIMKIVSWFIAISIFVSAIDTKALFCLLATGVLIAWYARIYLSMNKHMCELDFEQREPILTSLADALNGRNVIQAFKKGEEFLSHRLKLLDNSTIQFIAHQSGIAWFNIRVFFASKLITLLGMAICIEMKGTLDNTALFMIVNYTMNLQWINSLITCFGQLQQQIEQVEILHKLNEVPQEKYTGCCKKDLTEWPRKGKIEFKGVQASYQEDQEAILRNVSFEVQPGQSLSVVGRTGAGKSTLVGALTRLIELRTGEILIDGVDISEVDLEYLRSKITMISQEPELFQGTLRQNVDPFYQYDDKKIELAVWKSGLAELLIRNSTAEEGLCPCYNGGDSQSTAATASAQGQDGSEASVANQIDYTASALAQKACMLNFEVEEGGQNLSVGMRQLICIIRALLRESKIVVMDEPTSSIDQRTEQAIHKVFKDEFSQGVTVVTIAHRVNSILQNDQVLMLSKGHVIEHGALETLQDNPMSHLNQLLMEREQLEILDQESMLSSEIDSDDFADSVSDSDSDFSDDDQFFGTKPKQS